MATNEMFEFRKDSNFALLSSSMFSIVVRETVRSYFRYFNKVLSSQVLEDLFYIFM